MFNLSNIKISDIFSKIGDRKITDRKYINGCLIIAMVLFCTLVYLIITNIKWILLGIIVWAAIYFGKQVYYNHKNKGQLKILGYEKHQKFDEYTEL